MDSKTMAALRRMYVLHAKDKPQKAHEIAEKYSLSYAQVDWSIKVPQMNGFLREMIVCDVIGAKHRPSINGHDGYLPSGRPIEIKTETNHGGLRRNEEVVEAKNKMRGNIRFSNFSPKLAKQLLKDDMLIVVAGFTPEGQLSHIATFDYKESKQMHKILLQKSDPSFSATMWGQCKSLDVLYRNKKFINSQFMSPCLLSALNGSI